MSSLRLLAAVGFLLAVQAPPAAQSQQKFSRYSKPLRTATLDLETGTVTRGPAVSTQAVITVTDLPNLDLGGFIGVDTGAGFCEWIDSAAKGTAPVLSDLVTNFVFAYCSSRLDTASGGAGGTMTWTFFPSHTTGNNHPSTSTAVGIFTLTGLPSNTAEGAVFAQIACFFINITFGSTPLPFADGQVGYSWTFEDFDTVGVFAATFPFLSCVTSCSGSGPDGINMDDFVDQYCPPVPGSPPLATFSFGTTPFGGYFTSINMDMREVCVDAVTNTYNGQGINQDILICSNVIINQKAVFSLIPKPGRIPAPPPLGGLALLDIRAFGGPPGGPIRLDLQALLGNFGILPPGGDAPISELLCTGGNLSARTVIVWGAGGFASLNVPNDLDLVCIPWCAQAIVWGDCEGDPDPDSMWSTACSGIIGSE